MTDIETKIREQKNKIKEDQRELSRLQEEARKPKVKIIELYTDERKNIGRIKVENNRTVQVLIDGCDWCFDKPSEPKSYVDWDKIPKGYDWVAVDRDGWVCAYDKKPHIPSYSDGQWTGSWDSMNYSLAIKGSVPSWDKSLIHRLGIKE